MQFHIGIKLRVIQYRYRLISADRLKRQSSSQPTEKKNFHAWKAIIDLHSTSNFATVNYWSEIFFQQKTFHRGNSLFESVINRKYSEKHVLYSLCLIPNRFSFKYFLWLIQRLKYCLLSSPSDDLVPGNLWLSIQST